MLTINQIVHRTGIVNNRYVVYELHHRYSSLKHLRLHTAAGVKRCGLSAEVSALVKAQWPEQWPSEVLATSVWEVRVIPERGCDSVVLAIDKRSAISNKCIKTLVCLPTDNVFRIQQEYESDLVRIRSAVKLESSEDELQALDNAFYGYLCEPDTFSYRTVLAVVGELTALWRTQGRQNSTTFSTLEKLLPKRVLAWQAKS